MVFKGLCIVWYIYFSIYVVVYRISRGGHIGTNPPLKWLVWHLRLLGLAYLKQLWTYRLLLLCFLLWHGIYLFLLFLDLYLTNGLISVPAHLNDPAGLNDIDLTWGKNAVNDGAYSYFLLPYFFFAFLGFLGNW